MKDEIKIGEFVRTKDGRIGKILEPKPEYFDKKLINITKEISANVFIDYGEIIEYCKITEIKKHSTNILDVIEPEDVLEVEIEKVGDIVYIGIKKDTTEFSYSNIKKSIRNKEVKLLRILTHEQYEKNCYKMEE